MKALASLVREEDIAVTSVAGNAWEWAAARPSDANLYSFNMGLCTPVAVGLALALPHRRVLALESDGGILFSLSNLATVGSQRPPNLIIVVFDNECFLATGGSPSASAANTNIAAVAQGCGVPHVATAQTIDEFRPLAAEAFSRRETSLIVAKIEKRDTIRMVTSSGPTDGRERKFRFLRFIERTEGIRIVQAYAER